MADMTPQGTQAYGVESGYEQGDANVRGVVQGLLIIFLGVFVVMAAMFGMFRFLNNRITSQEALTPAALTQTIVPPEPRLLPSPYTDTQEKAQGVAKTLGENPGRATADVYPWDKRNLEISDQYEEANMYHVDKDKQGRVVRQQVPIGRAMQEIAGTQKDGTPATMSWMPEHPSRVTGEQNGSLILDPRQKLHDPRTYDYRAVWESDDEKFTSYSSGGTILKRGGISR